MNIDPSRCAKCGKEFPSIHFQPGMDLTDTAPCDVTGTVRNPATGKEEKRVLFVCRPCRQSIGGWRESEKFVQDFFKEREGNG
ncbi:hypothetical protein HMI49_04010 [Corallococcus exercitus]|uniref:Uncharacterized protein n=1 Tax=Corallococcus exercitus TaxID=2316736 RepID=A0A7Y4KEK7_9BACT|nr:hypothetical protein [Corallococcus exercitus]NOK32365.1 hypothetical protein [Corallococcus exercitus]